MRSSKSRSRNKSNRQRTLGNVVNRVFDSSGPEGKVRGTPQQIIDKYLALARDAQLSSDRVAEQSFLQHAEHYTRMLGEAQREMAERQVQQRPEGDEQPRERVDRDDRRGEDRRDDRRRDEAPQPEVIAEAAPVEAFPPARDVASEAAAEALPEAAAPAEVEAPEATETPEAKPKPRRAPRAASPRPRLPRKPPQAAEAPNGVASGD